MLECKGNQVLEADGKRLVGKRRKDACATIEAHPSFCERGHWRRPIPKTVFVVEQTCYPTKMLSVKKKTWTRKLEIPAASLG